MRLIENLRKRLDVSGVVGEILVDLSKTYDCLLHDLLIANLRHTDLILMACAYCITVLVVVIKG